MTLKQATAFITISVIWGSMWLAQQQSLYSSVQLCFAAIALALSAVALAILGAVLRLSLPRKQDLLTGTVVGVTLTALPYLLAVWTATRLPSSISTVITAATPLIAGFFCDTSWRARNISIAGLAGMVLVVGGIPVPAWSQLPWVVILLSGMCTIAATLVFAKQRLQSCHPIHIAAIELAAASIILAVAAFAKNPQRPSITSWIPLVTVAVGNALAAPLYFWLLKYRRADQLISAVWLQLLISIAEGIWFLHPHIEWRMAIGIVIILCSLVALQSSQNDEPVLSVRV
jgi:drug/metabolite transporter (DMT)-like permease